MTKKIAAIIFIFICTSAAWILLGGAMTIRTEDQDELLKGRVVSLWGKPQKQKAPTLEIDKTTLRSYDVISDGKVGKEMREYVETFPASLASSKIDVALDLEHRKKGLLWYSTYRVVFAGEYSFTNTEDSAQDYRFNYEFPAADGIYDSFVVAIDGKVLPDVKASNGQIKYPVRLEAGASCKIRISYESQGLDEWWYEFGQDVTQIRDFALNMTTDFEDFDFPENSMSPSSLEYSGSGAKLNWHYSNLLSGAQIGMMMPQKINPGPFVARVSFFAPVSLFMFFFLMLMIATLKNVNIHPMNYFFLAAAFFSFHLLMAYLVDHIDIGLAFFISAAVSIFLVISYMRLVVGARFALVETGLSQLVYLVLFSYAFFLEGYTGLTITITCIVTLFVVMMTTGRVDWGKLSERKETGS
ncbi:MAG: inner membrane CreD family protein [Candidatus Zixiibacteriota bacterium]